MRNAGCACMYLYVYVCVCTLKSHSEITIARSYLTIQINDREIASKNFQFSNLINYVKISTKKETRASMTKILTIDSLYSSGLIT